MRRALVLAGIAGSIGLVSGPASAQYRIEKVTEIELPGGKGHGDIATFDSLAQLLYVSMPNDGLCVVDIRANKTIKYIQNVPSPNGVDWDADYVYVAAADGLGPGNTPPAGKINDVIVIGKEKWKEVARVQTNGTSPDWIGVDRAKKLFYVDSDDNNQMEVYSTGEKPELKSTWPLFPEKPETGPDVATMVAAKDVIYQADDMYELKLNKSTGEILAKVDTGIKLTKKGGTKGSIYDAKNGHLWVGTTSKTPGILVLDAESLQIVKTLPQHGGADVVAFDPGLGLVYSFQGGANGFDVYDANTMTPVTFVDTGSGNTHTGDVDPVTHLIYAYEGDAGLVGVYKPVK